MSETHCEFCGRRKAKTYMDWASELSRDDEFLCFREEGSKHSAEIIRNNSLQDCLDEIENSAVVGRISDESSLTVNANNMKKEE